MKIQGCSKFSAKEPARILWELATIISYFAVIVKLNHSAPLLYRNAQILRRNKRRKPSEINRFQRVFGPSGATRTRGLDIPNVACYQLHYTRIFNCHDYTTVRAKIKVFPVCSHLCGQSGFWPGFAARKNPANACVARGSGLWLYPSWMKSTTLPKQARYQLRYTRLFKFYPAGRIHPNHPCCQLR